LYFHAHYFSDVIGGTLLAILWVALFLMVYPYFINHRRQRV
ncbi:PAP2 family protein, partial [Escherichia coli]|nr:PAP2 family protein [Escherichia coli]